MSEDLMRYDLLAQDALRGVVKLALRQVRKSGLPGEHHFFIAFDTRHPGVQISDRLRTKYPEEMTIILQHQFWDLKVADDEFEVGLSFGGIPEKLTVPFEAINGFFDPSVQFGLQFEEVTEGEEPQPVPTLTQDKAAGKEPRAVSPERPSAVAAPEHQPAAAAPEPAPEKPDGGGEIVRLDRFRKK